MYRPVQFIAVLTVILLTVIILSFKFFINKQSVPLADKIRIGIKINTEQQRSALKHLFPNQPEIDRAAYVEATTRWKEFLILQNSGLNPELIFEINKHELINSHFYNLCQVDSILESLQRRFQSIARVEKIGESAFHKLPINGIKISVVSAEDESEATVLFTAAHHGNELLGVNICLYILDFLCRNYSHDDRVKNWIDNLTIWIVPVVNPDGYNLVMDPGSKIIWRKNLRDNNGDGKFTPEFDGVDLNRNYAFNWDKHADQVPISNYYAGAFPFSEPETQAIRDLARKENFKFHLDFHSAGEIILYPKKSPSATDDENNIITIAKELAGNIKKQGSNSHYSIAPMNTNVGQCSLWMYNECGTLSFIIEAGDSYFPAHQDMNRIVAENAKAAFWVLDRASKLHVAPEILN